MPDFEIIGDEGVCVISGYCLKSHFVEVVRSTTPRQRCFHCWRLRLCHLFCDGHALSCDDFLGEKISLKLRDMKNIIDTSIDLFAIDPFSNFNIVFSFYRKNLVVSEEDNCFVSNVFIHWKVFSLAWHVSRRATTHNLIIFIYRFRKTFISTLNALLSFWGLWCSYCWFLRDFFWPLHSLAKCLFFCLNSSWFDGYFKSDLTLIVSTFQIARIGPDFFIYQSSCWICIRCTNE